MPTGSHRADRDRTAKRGDLRARLHGLAYLAIAGAFAFAHDEIVKLPMSRLAHAGEQITLASGLVLGLLGGLLVVEGGRLFGSYHSWDRRRANLSSRCRFSTYAGLTDQTASEYDGQRAGLGSAFDTRSGVAMVLSQRAIENARDRSADTHRSRRDGDVE